MNLKRPFFQIGLWVAVAFGLVVAFSVYSRVISERSALLFATLFVGVWAAARFLQGRAVYARDPRRVFRPFIMGSARIVGGFV